MFRSNVLVCGGTGCTSSNSEKIIEKIYKMTKLYGRLVKEEPEEKERPQKGYNINKRRSEEN